MARNLKTRTFVFQTPSIAAVTASLNSMGMAYDVHIVPQGSRVEKIALTAIVNSSLRRFRSEVGSLPDTILMFRDGVSEGYFDSVCPMSTFNH